MSVTEKERAFYGRRAAAELKRADEATDPVVASLHRELYARYQVLAVANESERSPGRWLTSGSSRFYSEGGVPRRSARALASSASATC